jgi:GGDEF domain-containing protein
MSIAHRRWLHQIAPVKFARILSSFNDVYGRGQGEAALAVVAQRLRSCIRNGDLASPDQTSQDPGVVARLGDNAFSILLADLDSQQRASSVAQRLLLAVAQPIGKRPAKSG